MVTSTENIPKLVRVPVTIKQGLPPLRLAIYGEGGVGKTTLALSFPHPLVIDTDGGLEGDAIVGLDPAKGDEWRPETWRDLNALYFWLKTQIKTKGYETIVLDSISELCILILHEAMQLPNKNRVENAEATDLIGAEKPDYGKVAYAVDSFLTKLKLLSKREGVHIVITSGVREPDETANPPRYKRSFDCQAAVESALCYWGNVYGELVHTEKVTGTGNNKVTTDNRILWTRANDPKRKNKTRFGALRPGVQDPTFTKIAGLIDPTTKGN